MVRLAQPEWLPVFAGTAMPQGWPDHRAIAKAAYGLLA